jgi:hypothetical protein
MGARIYGMAERISLIDALIKRDVCSHLTDGHGHTQSRPCG